MFWEYHSDRSGALLDTLDAALRGGDVMPLSGVWRFALDPSDEGLPSSWDGRALADRIRLPGVLQAQGKGDDVTVDTRWTGQIVDRSFFTVAAVRAVSPARATSRCRSGCSRTSTTSARRGTSATSTCPRTGRAGASCSTWSGRTGRRSRGSTTGSSARTTASRRRTSTTSARARARAAPAHDPRRQPPGRRRRRELAQRQRPHAGQLERHRRAGSSCGRRARCGSRTCRCSRTSRRASVRVRGRIGNATGKPGSGTVAARRSTRPGPERRSGARSVRRLVGRDGGASRSRSPLGADAPPLGRVLARALPAGRPRSTRAKARDTRADPSACARSRRRARSSRSTAARRSSAARSSAHLPEDRPPADGRGLVAADRRGSRRRTG